VHAIDYLFDGAFARIICLLYVDGGSLNASRLTGMLSSRVPKMNQDGMAFQAATSDTSLPLVPVARVGNLMQQFGNPFAPDWRDNAELGEVRWNRINHRSAGG
jgi:hypothetical protein